MLTFIKNLDTNKNSTFYSLINYKNKIICFRRKHWEPNIRVIEELVINEKFEILKKENEYRGEDPRCFYHNSQLYIVDNYFNDIHLINYNNKNYLKLWVKAKNLSFISHNGRLFFIFRMKPLILCEVSLNDGKVMEIYRDKQEKLNEEYRGGTPGYFKSKNIYYGFGHKTYILDKKIIHDVFMWELNLNKTPIIKITDIEKPTSKLICDPTSVIEVDNKKYLITAESDDTWFKDQDYITNVYKINFPSTF